MSPESIDNPASGFPSVAEATVELRGHTYADHRQVVPTLLESMAACGCWLLEQRALSPVATQLSFEVQLRSIYELYAGLICSGVEFTRDSHICMTSLCNVRNHNPNHTRRRRILNVRLELIFVEQFNAELSPMAMRIS